MAVIVSSGRQRVPEKSAVPFVAAEGRSAPVRSRSWVETRDTRVTPRQRPRDTGTSGTGTYDGSGVARKLDAQVKRGERAQDGRAGLARDLVRDQRSDVRGPVAGLTELIMGPAPKPNRGKARKARQGRDAAYDREAAESARYVEDVKRERIMRHYLGQRGKMSAPTRAKAVQPGRGQRLTTTHGDILSFQRESGMSYVEARDYLVARKRAAIAEATPEAPPVALELNKVTCDVCYVTVVGTAGCFCGDAEGHVAHMSDGSAVRYAEYMLGR